MTRRYLLPSILVAAIASAPLAFAVVAVRWTQLDIGASPGSLQAATKELMRTFVIAFDLLVLCIWPPCGLWLWRRRTRQIA